MSTRLNVVPLELSEANRLVAQWHRHHQPSQGHRSRWAKDLATRPDPATVPKRVNDPQSDSLFGEEEAS